MAAGGSLDGAVVAAWGLTFKASTDDLRDSPALAVIRRLNARGAFVRAFDPTGPDRSSPQFDGLDLEVCGDAYTACEDAEVLVLLTEWSDFAELDFAKVGALMRGRSPWWIPATSSTPGE